MTTVCDGCGTLLVDGGVDWYCPNKSCRHDLIEAGRWLREVNERKEREELARLKAKYEGEKR